MGRCEGATRCGSALAPTLRALAQPLLYLKGCWLRDLASAASLMTCHEVDGDFLASSLKR